MNRYQVALAVLALTASGFAQCNAFPCVVASVSLTNQTQAIPSTPVFTPPASGLFRTSVYLSVSASSNRGAEWELFLGWTDDLGPQKGETYCLEGRSNSSYATFVAQAVGGIPISYQTKPVSAQGTTYNLSIVVEQLQ